MMGDFYYEVCVALDPNEFSEIFTSEIMDFSGEAVEIADNQIIIRTSKDRQFIDAMLAHLQNISTNLAQINNTPINFTHSIAKKQNIDWIAEYKKSIKPLWCGRFCIYPPWHSGNLSLDFFNSFLDSHSIVDSANLKSKINPSLRDSCSESWQSKQNNQCVSTQNSPTSWCKKLESSKQFRASVDFLLEAKRRGSPHKSEKVAAFWCVGGAEMGVQPFLRKETSESKKQNDESCIKFTNPLAHSAGDGESLDLSDLDSLHMSQNDGFNIDCHDFASQNLAMTAQGMDCYEKSNDFSYNDKNTSDSQSTNSSENNPKQYPRPNCDNAQTINIVLEPSLAFGTGHHASTFMCIQALESLSTNDGLKGKYLLDFGCGSGILALCAAKMGAEVDLCDIDELAIDEAKKNFHNNNATISHIWQGSIGRKSAYDIIVANIIASVLIEQKENIDLSLKHGGIAILSGILDIYKNAVLTRFSDFEILAIKQKDEWICIMLRKF